MVAIETATDRLSVAVRADGETLEESVLGARRHAGALLPVLDRLLGAVGAGPGHISAVAVADGPGSFTGLRVGAAVAKAIALAGPVPLWTAPSLLVRAASVARPGTTVLAVSPALRGELFAGAWEFAPGGSIITHLAPRALGPGQFGLLPPVDLACGEGPPELLDALSRHSGAGAVLGSPAAPSASTLLGLVGVRGGAAEIAAPAAWEPEYGRPAEAQVQWELRHGRALPDPGRDAG
jgi:tRNA threonylcarbamoyladenosine biosynthesis protein TsaB